MIFGGDMPKANRYIIQNKLNKKYYRTAVDDEAEDEDKWFGGINEAWAFPQIRLSEQTNMLRRWGGFYEIIFKINEDGTRTQVR
jgi:hypothetical protein